MKRPRTTSVFNQRVCSVRHEEPPCLYIMGKSPDHKELYTLNPSPSHNNAAARRPLLVSPRRLDVGALHHCRSLPLFKLGEFFYPFVMGKRRKRKLLSCRSLVVFKSFTGLLKYINVSLREKLILKSIHMIRNRSKMLSDACLDRAREALIEMSLSPWRT